MGGRTALTAEEARQVGMTIATTARDAPERRAIVSPHGNRSFAELNARANQLVRGLRARGLEPGSGVALLCSNRPEFAEVFAAVLRAGFRLTCINWHLQGDEVAYIVDNCDARAFVGDARFAQVSAEAAAGAPKLDVRLAAAGPIDGFESYDAFLAGEDDSDIDDPVLGGTMLYTSGTTGRPKGVYRKTTPPVSGLAVRIAQTAKVDPANDLNMATGPLYHAAPLAFNLSAPLTQGYGSVLMDRWDPEETLRLVEAHGVTHTHMVATMFHRLLALPDEVRRRYDLSSLRFVIHGAAPTPVHVKKAMIEWLGPVVFEYYAATEGGGTYITPEEWLEKPGSVGKPTANAELVILDEAGERLPADEVGIVYFRAPDTGRFEYYKDAEKTSSAYRGDYFTLGDQGYVDGDGYVFLTGRSAEVIISGGVNIYPAEIDEVLLMHPRVADAATVGAPNDEWGEEVRSVVQLVPGVEPREALKDELIQFCRERLAHYKCPRQIDFDAELPRADTGKIYRRRVRDRYWQGRERRI